MKELSLYILDIVKNSTAAGATHVELTLVETEDSLTVTIGDNGRGMPPELLASVTDPFTTTRTTRNVGMGIPLYRMAAEMTGGWLKIESTLGVGTTVTTRFGLTNVDCPPLGDFPGTVAAMIQGSPTVDFTVTHTTPKGSYTLSTAEMREILGEDVPLDSPEVFLWLADYLAAQEEEV